MTNRRAGVLLAVALVTAGCKGKSPTTSLTAPPTITPSPVPVTAPASTPTTLTTAAPTTTTTVDSLQTAEAEVRAAVDALETAILDCARTIPRCDVTAFDTLIHGPALVPYKQRWADINNNGWAGRHLERQRFVIVKVEFPEPTAVLIDRAIASVCFADGSVTVKPGAAPDGSDVIIDEAFSTKQDMDEYRRGDDGRWRAYDFLKEIETLGGDTCPPA